VSGQIAIIDYGMGNLRSVEKGFENVGVSAFVTNDPRRVDEAEGVVLPGVGAFADAVEQLKLTGLDESIRNAVDSGRPFLGICLGLQLLFERSYENGDHQGLGVFKGVVERLPGGVKIPHMGWNQVKKVQDLEIMAGVADGADFYFVHSYVVRPEDPEIVATATEYGREFVSGVAAGNAFAFQFHPEKSGKIGLSMLKRFGAKCGALRAGALN
jgi:glutamine amidotransferase